MLEVILDLGRVPTTRYTDGKVMLQETEANQDEIKYVVDRVGKLDDLLYPTGKESERR